MTIICAWCDPEKTETRRLELEGHEVSHGICETHSEQVLREVDEAVARS